jgi:hypothetical protein
MGSSFFHVFFFLGISDHGLWSNSFVQGFWASTVEAVLHTPTPILLYGYQTQATYSQDRTTTLHKTITPNSRLWDTSQRIEASRATSCRQFRFRLTWSACPSSTPTFLAPVRHPRLSGLKSR